MPIIHSEVAPERSKRAGCGLWLLLVPPGLVLGLLAAAAVQPLQLGPYLLLVDAIPAPKSGWHVQSRHLPNPTPNTYTTAARNHQYAVTGGGSAVVLGLGDWLCGVAWLRGHRQR
jgi:hypothetical protein